MNSYNKLICLLVFITILYLFRSLVGHILEFIAKLRLFISSVGVTELILILIFLADLYLYRSTRRYYRASTYTEVPVGTTELVLYLIRYSNSYHITVGIPRPVIRNE